MTCFHPLKGYRSREINPETGKRSIVFRSSDALVEGSSVLLPCGQCGGCRTDRARQWAVRCMHEAQMHERNCFTTLTYDDDNVPQNFSVSLRDWQLFVKRLRRFAGDAGSIRFLGCGEYGEQTLRPHYHGLFFGWDFADKKLFRTRGDHKVYRSETLRELWPAGDHELGSVTFKSAGYVARYCLKKMTGELADDHYSRVSPVDGQTYNVSPEFCTMSLKPGLGAAWFTKFKTDAFPSDFLVVEGRKMRPPTRYLKWLADAERVAIERTRKRHAVQPAQKANATPARLRVREEVHARRLKMLLRKLG